LQVQIKFWSKNLLLQIFKRQHSKEYCAQSYFFGAFFRSYLSKIDLFCSGHYELIDIEKKKTWEVSEG